MNEDSENQNNVRFVIIAATALLVTALSFCAITLVIIAEARVINQIQTLYLVGLILYIILYRVLIGDFGHKEQLIMILVGASCLAIGYVLPPTQKETLIAIGGFFWIGYLAALRRTI